MKVFFSKFLIVISIILQVIWITICFIGISNNISHYILADTVVMFYMTFSPSCIYFLYKYIEKQNSNTTKSQNSNAQLTEAKPDTNILPKNTFANNDTAALENTVSDENSPNSSITVDTPVNSPEPSQEYIETEKTLSHIDGTAISDEEIPYLMQVGYEEVVGRNAMPNSMISYMESMRIRDKNKKEYTRIPSYNELSMIESLELPINTTDILFLKYINGLTLEKPFIAQYWFYDYNLNYSKEIKKLIAVGLMTIQNVNIEKLKVPELKNILRNFNLPLTGTKNDLQKRIYANITDEELSDFLGNENHYFCATEKGQSYINKMI